jgi:RNA polymerase sigma-70 factor (ECF subfamily)
VASRVVFEKLYRSHAGAVLAFARRRTTPGDAEDVVAEVFLIAWRRLDDVPGDALPWLLGVARRVLANRRRSESRAAGLRARVAAEQRTEAAVARLDADSPVLRALWSLSESDQEVLMLVAWDGLDRGRAAAVLGVTPGTLAVRLHRARRRLARARAHQQPLTENEAERSSAMEAT